MVCAMGPKPVLEKVASSAGLTQSIEQLLFEYCINQARRGFPLKRDNLCILVKKIIEEEGLDNPFKIGVPGKTWFQAFLRRHPTLTQKKAEHHSLARAAVTETALRSWFTRIFAYIKEAGQLPTIAIAERMLNGDETPFRICEISGIYFHFKKI